MDKKTLIDDVFNKVLYYAMGGEYHEMIKEAGAFYGKGLDADSIDIGFKEWLLKSFKLENGKSFYEMYESHVAVEAEEKAVVAQLKGTIFSVFKTMNVGEKTLLKDIVTNEDFHLLEMNLDSDMLIAAHLVKEGNGYYLLGDYETLDTSYETLLKKGVFEKYNEYCTGNKAMGISEFIRSNEIIIGKLLLIIMDSEYKMIDGEHEEYKVHQATYIFNDKDEIRKVLESKEKYGITTDEADYMVFKMMEDDTIIAEVVIAEKRMEIECHNDLGLDYCKEIVESDFGDLIIHLQDEVLDIDDLLG